MYSKTKTKIDKAFSNSDDDYHLDWISDLLKNYYDPMYDYQLLNKKDRCIANGNENEIISIINDLEKNQY
jgi:tRNA 2-selenouridine synthase